MMDQVYDALRGLRVPLQQVEYDLHRLVMDQLARQGIAFEHEKKLGPRCRIDLMAEGIGIEIKKGRPDGARLKAQLERYAAFDEVCALIVVSERNVAIPRSVRGKPVRLLCLNRLWGIAL